MGQAPLILRAVIMPCRANPTKHRKSQAVCLQIKSRPTANKSLCWFVSALPTRSGVSRFQLEILGKKKDPTSFEVEPSFLVGLCAYHLAFERGLDFHN